MTERLRPLVLIVDDEQQILRFLTHALEASGYDVLRASTGEAAIALCRARSPDQMLLDLGLPDLDGKTVIEILRRESDLPIIVLSAHDQEMEKIMALDLGADDFVSKPFAIGELLARMRASLRMRERREPREMLRFDTIAIDRATREVRLRDQLVRLTPKEFDLLLALAAQPGRVMTHRQLLEKVWGPAHVGDLPYLRVFIGQLRQKLELGPGASAQIRTEAGIGYRWLLRDEARP